MRSTYAENQHTLMHLCWPISEQVHSRSLCALRRKDNSSVGHQYLSPVTPALPPRRAGLPLGGLLRQKREKLHPFPFDIPMPPHGGTWGRQKGDPITIN
jgi:hypothetical protein